MSRLNLVNRLKKIMIFLKKITPRKLFGVCAPFSEDGRGSHAHLRNPALSLSVALSVKTCLFSFPFPLFFCLLFLWQVNEVRKMYFKFWNTKLTCPFPWLTLSASITLSEPCHLLTATHGNPFIKWAEKHLLCLINEKMHFKKYFSIASTFKHLRLFPLQRFLCKDF